MKNTIEVSSKSLIITGNNFISESLYKNFKRNGKLKVSLKNNIDETNNIPTYIIDCSLDKESQDKVISYCKVKKVQKLLLINNNERTDLPIIDTVILQSILYDIYGVTHNSFVRSGFGNNFDDNISYYDFISESIRRILEAKMYNYPLVYIPSYRNKIKYTHVDNIYESINYMLNTFKNNCTYLIYDDEKTSSCILSIIKRVLDYSGNVVELYNDNLNFKPIKTLDFYFKKNYLDYEIKKIYHYLILNNDRFII